MHLNLVLKPDPATFIRGFCCGTSSLTYTHSDGKRRKNTYIWVAWKIKVILVESDLCRSSSPTLCWAQCQYWVQVSSLSVLSICVLRFNSFMAIPVPIFYFSCSCFFFPCMHIASSSSFQFIAIVSCHIHHWRTLFCGPSKLFWNWKVFYFKESECGL